jgi:hypothetical protein
MNSITGTSSLPTRDADSGRLGGLIARRALHACECIDLDKVAGAEQGGHLDRGAGRRLGTIDVTIADLADHGQDRHVGHVDAELDDVRERGTGCREGQSQVLEDALGLGAGSPGPTIAPCSSIAT